MPCALGHREGGPMRAIADLVDLVLARACVACQAWGDPLCAECLRTARESGGRHASWAFGTGYQGIGKAAVLAHKRHGVRSLGKPLGLLLADAVRHVCPSPMDIALVPIPSHREALRARGQDTVRAIAGCAARTLHDDGYRAEVIPLLRRPMERPSLAGANRAQRQHIVHGAFANNGFTASPVVIVDDVLTTGATLREAMRTLQARDLRGAAVVAAVLDRSTYDPGDDGDSRRGTRLSSPRFPQ